MTNVGVSARGGALYRWAEQQRYKRASPSSERPHRESSSTSTNTSTGTDTDTDTTPARLSRSHPPT
jgi:hypothetical protein